jgi:hypothetical protein
MRFRTNCRHRSSLLALLGVGLTEGCVYVPITTHVYDPECKIYANQMTLGLTQLGVFGSCSGDQCTAMLVAAGAVAAASAVVSGSIVIAGNVVYWFEKRGKCDR